MIEEAGPSDRQMTGEINEIIEIFPYCQSAYMLLLKGLQNTSDVSFENQLRTSAMRIADREVLYYYLKDGKERYKHPTQKPLALLTRIILASTTKNSWILDPFTGSSTTGIAANLTNRKFLGIDKEEPFLIISKNRKLEIENPMIFERYRKTLCGFKDKNHLDSFLVKEPEVEYGRELDL